MISNIGTQVTRVGGQSVSSESQSRARLTGRELLILVLLRRGYSETQIADLLGSSAAAVHEAADRAAVALGAADRVDALADSIRRGLID